jgi:small GTP-binding protein
MNFKSQIVIVGASNCGKSSLLGKLEKGDFIEKRYEPTLGIEAHKLCMEIDGKSYDTTIYDSQGFDNNPGIMFIPQFKKYSAFIVVYDITNENSYSNAKQCIDEIRKLCPLENQYIIVLGNKDDLE